MKKIFLVILLLIASIVLVGQVYNLQDPLLKYVQTTSEDVAASVVCAMIFPLSQTLFDPTELTDSGDANKDIPIILVHGFMHNSSGMILLRKRLNDEGFTNVFTVDMGVIPWFKSIEDFAAALEQKIDQVLKGQSDKKVRLIGHSMGGVVSAHYALRVADKKGVTVCDVITLGSPLKGTKIAVLGFGECARQMECDSNFSVQLSRDIIESEIRFHHFASKTDLIMRPYHTSLNGEEDETPRSRLVDLGHVSYLFSRKVIRDIVEILLG